MQSCQVCWQRKTEGHISWFRCVCTTEEKRSFGVNTHRKKGQRRIVSLTSFFLNSPSGVHHNIMHLLCWLLVFSNFCQYFYIHAAFLLFSVGFCLLSSACLLFSLSLPHAPPFKAVILCPTFSHYKIPYIPFTFIKHFIYRIFHQQDVCSGTGVSSGVEVDDEMWAGTKAPSKTRHHKKQLLIIKSDERRRVRIWTKVFTDLQFYLSINVMKYTEDSMKHLYPRCTASL